MNADDQGLMKVRPNLLDRVVTYFDPARGAQRIKNRAQTGMFDAMIGAWTGARTDKRSMLSWVTSPGSANADTLTDLRLLRQRSRDLIRNQPLAGGVISTVVSNVVGSGLTLQSRIDRDFLGLDDEAGDKWQEDTEREFCLWADSTDCDLTRTQTFGELQDLVFRSALESGDAFTLLPMVQVGQMPYSTRVQIIEADRVCNKQLATNSLTLAGGIELDQYGAPKAYHILQSHPGDFLNQKSWTWDVVPAFGGRTGRRNVLHHFRRTRPGQNRGVPYLAPVIEAFKSLGTYSDAELQAAVVSALFTVFVKSNGTGLIPGLPGTMSAETGATMQDTDLKLASGAVIDLGPGEDIVIADPKRPNANFDPFVLAVLRQIGVALEVPFEVLVKHFNSSYSAARASLLEAWRFFKGRRAWLAASFCQPVYETWLDEAVALGRIKAPGYFSDPAIRHAYAGASWIGDSPGQINPKDEADAAKLRLDMGVSDLATETAAITGMDWETTHRQQVKERRMRLDAGLIQPQAGAAAPNMVHPDGPTPGADPEGAADGQDSEDPKAPGENTAILQAIERQGTALHELAYAAKYAEPPAPPQAPAAPEITVNCPEVSIAPQQITMPEITVTMPPVSLNVTMEAPRASGRSISKRIELQQDEAGETTGYRVITEDPDSGETTSKTVEITRNPDGTRTGLSLTEEAP